MWLTHAQNGYRVIERPPSSDFSSLTFVKGSSGCRHHYMPRSPWRSSWTVRRRLGMWWHGLISRMGEWAAALYFETHRNTAEKMCDSCFLISRQTSRNSSRKQKHYLFEVGGNIGKSMMIEKSVYQYYIIININKILLMINVIILFNIF